VSQNLASGINVIISCTGRKYSEALHDVLFSKMDFAAFTIAG
jgi:hypothetical protein